MIRGSVAARVRIMPTQAQFLAETAEEAIYRGGLGAGKTLVLCFWALPRAYSGRQVILTEPTYPMVRDVLAPSLQKAASLFGWRYNLNRSAWDFSVGAGKVILRSGVDPDALRGINAHDFGMDEASYQSRAVYDQLSARARETLDENGNLVAGGDAQGRLVGSPNGRDWVYKLAKEAGVPVFTQSTFRNPFLPEAYKRRLVLRYTTEQARQELEGEIIDQGRGVLSGSWLLERAVPTFAPVLRVRSWDLAATEKSYGDFSASCLLSTNFEKWRLEEVDRLRVEWGAVRARIIQTAHRDGPGVPIVVEGVGMQKALVHELRHAPELHGFQVVTFAPVGSKFNRALSWSPKAEQGLVEVAPGAHLEDLREEMDAFSADGSQDHDDMVDAISQAFVYALENPVASSGRARGLY